MMELIWKATALPLAIFLFYSLGFLFMRRGFKLGVGMVCSTFLIAVAVGEFMR